MDLKGAFIIYQDFLVFKWVIIGDLLDLTFELYSNLLLCCGMDADFSNILEYTEYTGNIYTE